MHNVENILVLGFNFDANFLALRLERGLKVDEPDFIFIRLGKENHVEKAVENVLVNAKNIDFVISENFGDGGDNADSVPADDGND